MEMILKIAVWLLVLILVVWEIILPSPGTLHPIELIIKVLILVLITIIIVIEWRKKKRHHHRHLWSLGHFRLILRPLGVLMHQGGRSLLGASRNLRSRRTHTDYLCGPPRFGKVAWDVSAFPPIRYLPSTTYPCLLSLDWGR